MNSCSKKMLRYGMIPLLFTLVNCTVAKRNSPKMDIMIHAISEQFHVEGSHLETAIVINEKDPNNLVVTAMISEGGHNILHSVIYFSKDGGRTWNQGFNMENNSTVFPSGDPYLASDENGNLYFSTLFDGFTIWKSSNRGASWEFLAKVPGSDSYDREWIVADVVDKEHTHIYTAGKFDIDGLRNDFYPEAVAISRSTDGGVTFSSPLTFLAMVPNEALNSMLGMHLTQRGKLIIAFNRFYIDLNTRRAKEGAGNVILRKIQVLTSEDRAKSFKEYLVSEHRAFGHSQEIKSMKTKGLGGLASHTTGNKEIVYITWIEAINGFGQNVVSSSLDGGKSWSKPVIVNDSLGLTSDVSNPNLAVNKDGLLLAIWNDRRQDQENICFQVMGAFSFNNGRTFEAPFLIDDQLTCPCRDGTGEVTVDCRFSGGGDTQGITAHPDGSFVVVFPSEKNNRMELLLAKIRLDNS